MIRGKFLRYGLAVLTAAAALMCAADPFRIRESNENALKAGVADRVKFFQGDLFQTDLSEASVVALYLLPELNVRLRPKLFRELKPGTRIVSHDFHMGDWKPDYSGLVKNVSYQYFEIMGHERDAQFYYWVIPADAGGLWRLSMETPTGQRSFNLRLEQTFQEIKGSIIDRGQETAILDAKLLGDQINFTMKDEREKRPVTMHFNGRISGDTMKGSTVVQEGSSTRLDGCGSHKDLPTIENSVCKIERWSWGTVTKIGTKMGCLYQSVRIKQESLSCLMTNST